MPIVPLSDLHFVPNGPEKAEYAWQPDLKPPAYLLHPFTPLSGLVTFSSAADTGAWQTFHDRQRWLA